MLISNSQFMSPRVIFYALIICVGSGWQFSDKYSLEQLGRGISGAGGFRMWGGAGGVRRALHIKIDGQFQ
jgi:hypothetical protein